jgi:Tfp pilus assembly protein PilF
MQRAVEADPDNAVAHERLARAAMALGETERAAVHARRAAELHQRSGR